MSRIGNKPVAVPKGVDAKLDGRTVTAKGKLGQLSWTISDDVEFEFADNEFTLKPVPGNKRSRALWGANRTQLANLFEGVSEGFSKELEVNGVGYRAQVQGKDLVLNLGYSHEIRYPIPQGIEIKCEKPTSVLIKGADKQQVGQIAAELRAFRPPEPYKGKGVKYVNETILRKEGKKK